MKNINYSVQTEKHYCVRESLRSFEHFLKVSGDHGKYSTCSALPNLEKKNLSPYRRTAESGLLDPAAGADDHDPSNSSMRATHISAGSWLRQKTALFLEDNGCDVMGWTSLAFFPFSFSYMPAEFWLINSWKITPCSISTITRRSQGTAATSTSFRQDNMPIHSLDFYIFHVGLVQAKWSRL